MPPKLLQTRSDFNTSTSPTEFRSQFTHPGDVFSILLLLGPDVVAQAIAQLAGGLLCPVTFSFGWVAYGVSALVSAVGENKLMPDVARGSSSIVINGNNGYVRNNNSWVIERLIRDYEKWMHPDTEAAVELNKDDKLEALRLKAQEKGRDESLLERPAQAGLCIAVYKPSETRIAAQFDKDMLYYSGLVTAAFQLGIAAIPYGLFGDEGIFMITVAGIVLSFLSGSLPQWRKEKWACRRDTNKHVTLTRGNGSQHAIIVLGNGHGLDLEDLANGPANNDASASIQTRVASIGLAIAWVLLLIAAAGLKENSWFLLAVGSVGMLQNVAVAGYARQPSALGVHLDFVQVLRHYKVMDALYEVEKTYPGVGASMRATFFPGELNTREKKTWEAFAADRKMGC